MSVIHYPDDDTLKIRLVDGPVDYDGGQDAEDPDLVAHFAKQEGLVGLEISHASRRVDVGAVGLGHLRGRQRRLLHLERGLLASSAPTPQTPTHVGVTNRYVG